MNSMTYHQSTEHIINSDAMVLWKTVFAHSHEGIILADLQGRCIDLNSAATRLLGYERQDLLGQPLLDLALISDHESVQSLRHHAAAHLPLENIKLALYCKSGLLRPIVLSLCPIFLEETQRVCIFLHDATDHKQTERSLSTLVENEDDRHSAKIFGTVHDITVQNAAAEQVRNHARHMQIVTKLYDVLTEVGLDYQTVIDLAVKTIGESLGSGCMIRTLSESGESLDEMAIYDIDPQVRSALESIMRTVPIPINEESLSRSVFDTKAPLLLSVVDPQTFIATVKAEFRPLIESIHLQRMIIVPMHNQKQIIGLLYLWRHRQQPTPFRKNELTLAQDLADRVALNMSNAKLYQQLQAQLEQRRQAEQSMRIAIQEKDEVLAQLDALFSSTPMGMGIWDKEFKLLRINRALSEFNNLPNATDQGNQPGNQLGNQLGNQPNNTNMELDGREQLLPIWQQILQTGKPRLNLNHTLNNVAGEHKHLTGNFFPVYSGETVIGIGASVLDITERKHAENALRFSEERLQLALSAANMGVWEWQAATKKFYLSPECLAIFGLDDTPDDYFPIRALIHDEDREQIWPSLGRMIESPGVSINEFRIVRPDGELRWIANVGQGVYDNAGHLVRMVGTLQDITARVQGEAERAALAEQLRQSQKMETIGRLTGGIAHDFNNLLTVIQGYSDLLLVQVPATSPQHYKLEQIHSAGKRAAALTSQLLAFSRKQILQPSTINLNHLITDLQSMLQRLLGEDVFLRIELAPNLHTVVTDRSQLDQVLMNLAVNAREAMSTGGYLFISTHNSHTDSAHCPAHLDLPPGDCVILRIRDTGCGMTEEIRSQIFEPFFTTKPKGQGTGLGLSTVFGIVKQSGGDIQVESMPGEGTTFTIRLPASLEEPSVVAQETMQPALPKGSETILLVEDEEMVRDLVETTLQNEGYTVIKASSGPDALVQIEERLQAIDLLVTDVVMPQMSGRELAEQLLAMHPNLRVLFTSGYTDDAVMRHGISSAEVEFLQKPYLPDVLTAKVRSVLNKVTPRA